MSRTDKNRKNLPKHTQRMWKDSGHQIRKAAFLGVSSDEYEDATCSWEYKPLSRHTALNIHSSNVFDDIMTSFYRNYVNFKYKNKVWWR